MQDYPMQFDPSWGHGKPYPSDAEHWRHYRPKSHWLFNPWTGKLRHKDDLASDPFGLLIVVSIFNPLKAAIT